ncbi:methyltransferase domain-containing protein [Azospirillum soli]|uniref:methyltransferase domain-containing protein n=1 Tax=Azospirillum soli TaxID=1304799 RepID=UPI001AE453CA|nr:methyltransferase domain-containing protein [Azospirillum soli]MBP2312566.1 SAM-dependent methyltransferase [Azospirillum soli]
MSAVDLSRRCRLPELMDTEPVAFEEFQDCLRDLTRINRWSLAYRPTLGWLDRVVRAQPGRPLRILDVGFGHGDMLRRIAGWARTREVAVQLTGVDLNPWSARTARLATPPDLAIDYRVGNVFDLENEGVDIVISALFTHHLDDEELVRFIRWMERRSAVGWFINDLHRHPIPYWFVRGMVRTVPVNRLVVHDAPVSVARAFTRRDWRERLRAAGLPDDAVTVDWCVPFRFGVGRIK